MKHNTLRSLFRLTMLSMLLAITIPSLAKAQQTRGDTIITKTVQQAPSFDTIQIDGPITLKLQQNPQYHHQIIIQGPEKALSGLNLTITANRLNAHMPAHRHQGAEQATITVQTPMLNELYQSAGSSTTAHFRDQSKPLAVYLRNNSTLTLDGMVQLQSLQQQDNSQSHIVFTNSKQLDVQLHDESTAYVAGRAQHILAKLSDASTLSGQYLRANQAWLQAQEASTLYISPVHESHAFAEDTAQIIYHSTPQTSTTYHAERSNILRDR